MLPDPNPETHPLLKERLIKSINIRFGESLYGMIEDDAEAQNCNPHTVVRKILAEHYQPTKPPVPTGGTTPMSQRQQDYNAFANLGITNAIQAVARGIEDGSIQRNYRDILNHFLSYCPTTA